MHRFTRFVLVAAVLALGACASAPKVMNDASAEKEIARRVELLLDRYSRNDQAGVLAMLDPDRFVLLGTNFDEKTTTPAQLRAVMDRDFALWKSATFRDFRDFDVRTDGTLATVNCLFTFEASAGPTITVRSSTTWRKVNGEWLLTQSSNALPPQF